MSVSKLVQEHLASFCPEIHNQRLQALMDVAMALQKSKNLSLTALGRNLDSDIDVKHRIKKVDRLVGNKHLYSELTDIYAGLSNYVFKYLSQDKHVPLVVDVCFMKDNHDVQMLSAEVATKGRSIPVYRDVFKINELKKRAKEFVSELSKCIPSDKDILLIMDSGFGDEWFDAIESKGWHWLVRARHGKYVKLSKSTDWQKVSDLFSKIGTRAKNYPEAFITKSKHRPCRIITKKGVCESKRKKPLKLPRNYNAANGDYRRSAKEPWILATNLPDSYSATQILNYYKKRMQIEESFRDIKSHQFGLSARYIRTSCIYRWGVQMLLAAIVQITLWVIGIIGHSKGFQRKFQANTVKDKKVFSYFYLGQLIVEFGKLEELDIDYENIQTTIVTELARQW